MRSASRSARGVNSCSAAVRTLSFITRGSNTIVDIVSSPVNKAAGLPIALVADAGAPSVQPTGAARLSLAR